MCISDECKGGGNSRRSFISNAAAALAGVSVLGPNAVSGRQQKSTETKALDDPNITHGRVAFRNGPNTIEGYLARPKAAGRFRAVVIFSPNPGLPEDIRNTAAQLAQGSFVGLAVNAYSRAQGLTPDRARQQFDYYGSRSFDEQHIRDVQAGLNYLRRQPFFKGGGIGVVGFCGGGRQALIFPTKFKEVRAVVSFYGPPLLSQNFQASKGPFKTDVMDVVDQIKVPVQGHYGALDPVIPVSDVKRLERELQAQSTPEEIFIYEGAAHAFYDYTRPRYNPEAAQLAHTRMMQFLKRYLK
jgi:carboxymethylenebutenolidase